MEEVYGVQIVYRDESYPGHRAASLEEEVNASLSMLRERGYTVIRVTVVAGDPPCAVIEYGRA